MNEPASSEVLAAQRNPKRGLDGNTKQYLAMTIVLVLIVGVFSVLSKSFLQWSTVGSIANQIPDLLIISVGMTVVLMIGGIDLSVGSVLALSSAVLGMLMVDKGWPFWPAAMVAVLVAALCGVFNGSMVVAFKVPSFIITLGMLEIARGGCYVLTNSETKYIGSSIEWIGSPIAGLYVSPAFVVAIVGVFAGQFILERTVFGRLCTAIGTNAETVRMSGIRSAPYSIAVFTLSSLLCGVAGIMQSSRLSSADPNAAVGIELAAIASCVIGGTSLMGGRGSIISTFFGVLIIAVLQSGLANIGATEPTKRIMTGGVIVAAVLLDAIRKRASKIAP